MKRTFTQIVRAAVAATVMRLVHPEAAGILGQPLLSR